MCHFTTRLTLPHPRRTLPYPTQPQPPQRDPGEALAELQAFAAVADPHLRRYAIDAHLGRHEAALRSLAAAGPEHFARVGGQWRSCGAVGVWAAAPCASGLVQLPMPGARMETW